MDDITENFVTECLIKVQMYKPFFESMCGKNSAGWMDTIHTKKKLLEYSVSTQIKTTPE